MTPIWIAYIICMLLTWLGFYFFAKEHGQFKISDLITCVLFSFIPVLNFGSAVLTITYAIGKVASMLKFLDKVYYVKPFK